MTTPLGQLRDVMPWLDQDGCTACGLDVIATVDLYCGRRCRAHPPAFDCHVSTQLRLAGWHATADAYARTHAA